MTLFCVRPRSAALLRLPVSAVCAATVLATQPLWAQTVPASDDLRSVIVTATRTEARASALTADVVVLDQAVLQRSAGRTVSELLAREAGLQMSSTGGLGKQSSLYVRGTEARHVLLLIDGVRVGSSTAGAASFDNLPLEAIERIEVLKGPASALYGSDAVGGVVHIFTRQGGKGFSPSAAVTLGQNGHSGAVAALQGGDRTLGYALTVGRKREDGFSATNPKVAFGGHNADRDGFDQTSLSASARAQLAPGWQTSVSLSDAQGTNHYDNGPSAFDVRAKVITRALAWGLTHDAGDGRKTRLTLSRSDDRSTNLASATSTSRFDTQQTQTALQHEWRTPLGTALVGAERLKEGVNSTQKYAVNQRTTDGLFVGLQGQADAHLWQLNARRDDNSQFGAATTGVASYGFRITPQWRAHGAVGTSFKAPSFNTLYWDSPTFKGNPSTQPERGHNREVGLTYTAGAHETRLTRFDNRVRGFITTAPVVANIPRARMAGWALGHEGSVGAWSWRTGMEWLDATNLATGKQLPRRAERQLTAGLDHSAGAWTLGANVLAASDRFDNATNTQRMGGFGTVDVHARYALAPDWALQLRVNNLGDKAYETAYGYNQPGRTAYLTLNWSPKK